MKKTIKCLILTAFFPVAFMACKTEVEPVNEIDETAALNTREDVLVYLTGCYDGLGSVNFEGGAVQYISELLGDNGEVSFTGTYASLDEIASKAITTGNTQVTATWTSAYSTINRCNNVLSALDKIPDEAERKHVEGEALFIRGLVYFDLVNLFAKTWVDGDNNSKPGVPIVTEPTRGITDADYRARNSVAEVYNLVLADLTKAEIELSGVNEENTRATEAAVAGVLSRVYLMQEKYQEAKDEAAKAIAAKDTDPAATFEDVFDESSGTYNSEMIFRLGVTPQDGGNDLSTFFASEDFQGRGDIPVLSKHIALYNTGDKRKDFFTLTGTSLYTNKFNDQYGDVPVLRISEMYLTLAECNFRLEHREEASSDLQRTRKRAGLTTPIAPLDLTLPIILKERHLEMAFEGRLLNDVKRTKQTLGTLPYNDGKLVLPIPQREIDTNKMLEQNEAYL